MYYIQNAGFCGNSAFWWRQNKGGYTCDLNHAGRYTREEAEDICRTRPKEDKMWPVGEIDALAERHVDGNILLRKKKETRRCAMKVPVTCAITPRKAASSAVDACDAFVDLAGLLGTSEPLKRADDTVRAGIGGAVNRAVRNWTWERVARKLKCLNNV